MHTYMHFYQELSFYENCLDYNQAFNLLLWEMSES